LPATRAQLIPVDGGPPIDLVKDVTVVGRKEECDLRLENKSVSKMHCVIVKTDGLLLVRDLGSTNGTRVNGQRVRRAALLPNDQLTIASYKFRIHLGPAPLNEPHHDRTQHLEAAEVAQLLRKADAGAPSSDRNEDNPPLHPNALPDIYPADEADKPGPGD
jgi:predicted component of type VI protein secretion system